MDSDVIYAVFIHFEVFAEVRTPVNIAAGYYYLCHRLCLRLLAVVYLYDVRSISKSVGKCIRRKFIELRSLEFERRRNQPAIHICRSVAFNAGRLVRLLVFKLVAIFVCVNHGEEVEVILSAEIGAPRGCILV